MSGITISAESPLQADVRALIADLNEIAGQALINELGGSVRFVRADVIGTRELLDAGGYAQARDVGTLRTEGRDYVMQDGDVITVKHTN